MGYVNSKHVFIRANFLSYEDYLVYGHLNPSYVIRFSVSVCNFSFNIISWALMYFRKSQMLVAGSTKASILWLGKLRGLFAKPKFKVHREKANILFSNYNIDKTNYYLFVFKIICVSLRTYIKVPTYFSPY